MQHEFCYQLSKWVLTQDCSNFLRRSARELCDRIEAMKTFSFLELQLRCISFILSVISCTALAISDCFPVYFSKLVRNELLPTWRKIPSLRSKIFDHIFLLEWFLTSGIYTPPGRFPYVNFNIFVWNSVDVHSVYFEYHSFAWLPFAQSGFAWKYIMDNDISIYYKNNSRCNYRKKCLQPLR